MPELPEVETIVRQLAPLAVGQRVRTFEVYDPLLGVERPEILKGRRIVDLRRLGKQILMKFGAAGRNENNDNGKSLWVAIHLRMTGRLLWLDAPPTQGQGPAPLRACWRLDRGALAFHDTRRFGTIRLLTSPEAARPAGLDPTADEFTVKAFSGLLAGSTTPIKPWLLRQDRLVGIGNIYASEALYAARIHPARPAGSLARAQVERLRLALRDVLARAIEAGGTTFSDFQNARGDIGNYQHNLRVYDRAGDPCDACGRPIQRIVQQQRSTFYCPRCQRGRRKR